MKSKLKQWIWKLFWKIFPPETMIDKIRTMEVDELVHFVYSLSAGDELWAGFAERFCDSCKVTGTAVINGHTVKWHPCDDGECPHGDAVRWWLQQAGE